jgi:hypothetical protein
MFIGSRSPGRLFVFTGSAPTVHAGDSVLVPGKVQDFYPLSSGDTVATTSNLSVTEIDQTGVSVLSSGSPLPAPIVLGPDAAPAAYAPDLGGQNIETTQITPSRPALDFYESIEGMRVEVDNARVVGPSGTFGEEYITTKPAQNASFRGGTLLEGENATPARRRSSCRLPPATSRTSHRPTRRASSRRWPTASCTTSPARTSSPWKRCRTTTAPPTTAWWPPARRSRN